MRRRSFLLSAAGLAGIVSFSKISRAEEEPSKVSAKPALSVAIAVPGHFDSRSIDADGEFPVVITNNSQENVNVWHEWCSWGYFQMHFVLRNPQSDGPSIVVSKKDQIWDKNYPDYWTLAPGEPLVWPVRFNPEVWNFGELAGNLQGKKMNMRAVFRCPADNDTKEHHVWTGSIESAERLYEFH